MKLPLHTLVSGLVSVLTPGVFLFLLVTVVLFERIEYSSTQRKINPLLFSLFSVLIAVFLIPEIIESGNLNDDSSYILLLDLLQITFLLWILSSFSAKYQLFHTQAWKQFFRFLGLLILSWRLVLVSLSSAGPILGAILIYNPETEEFPNTYGALLGFSIGLIIPFIVVLWLVSTKHHSLRSKSWWRMTQLITAGVLLTGLLMRLVNIICLLKKTCDLASGIT